MRRSATLPVTDFQNVVHCKIAASNLFRRRMSEDVLYAWRAPIPALVFGRRRGDLTLAHSREARAIAVGIKKK